MTQIDWSRAPEGATHARYVRTEDDGSHNVDFFRLSGKKFTYWSKRYSDWREAFSAVHECIQKPAVWAGEGKPPVGAIVEIHRGKWNIRIDSECFLERPVTVAAVFKMSNGTEMVSVDGGPEIGCEVFRAECVRPVRTPEQIATDEKGRIINQMVIDSGWTINGCPSQWVAAFEALHEAGYRKMMSDAEEVKA